MHAPAPSPPAGASTTAGLAPPELSDAFRVRRTQNWLVLGLLYAFFYATRYNLTSVMDVLAGAFHWTNTDLGVFETTMPLVYGLSVFLNGPLADRIGGKRAFLFGAAGVTAMNALFGLAIHLAQTGALLRLGLPPRAVLYGLAVVWGVNGYFQSFGALSIVKVNAQWFHVRERGTFAGIFGVLIRLGLILAFSGVPLIAAFLPLSWAFWLPAACVLVLFVLNWRFMEDSPEAAGLGDFDTGDETAGDPGARASLGEVLERVFASRVTWTIAVASMMIGLVRRSTLDAWYPKYFADVHLPHGVTNAAFAPYQTAAWGIALCGILGGFAFGIASDRIYDGRRSPVIAYGFGGMAVTLALFGLSDRLHLGPWLAALLLSCLSFFVNGAHGMIGGAASMDFGGRKAAATAAGLFDGMQYLASSVVGVGMGWLLDRWGWAAWQWAPIPFALIGAALIATIWSATPQRRP